MYNACAAVACAVALMATAARADGGSENAPRGGDEPWVSCFRDVQTGPVRFDFGAQARVRYERFEEYTMKGYKPGMDDELLLERLRIDMSASVQDGPRFFLQFQDAHAFLTRYGNDDFPESSPIEDTMDVRQLYLEWERIGGGFIGFRAGRQQIAYGDQRVFGPGSWGNTGRYAWDAAMLKFSHGHLWADAWIGRYLQYRSDEWPNRSVDDFVTAVAYGGVRFDVFRLDLFYVFKRDEDGAAGSGFENELLVSHTAGMQMEAALFGCVDASATLIGQFGDYGPRSLRAFGANARAGLTAPVSWRPRLGAQITWGSGDDDPDDGVHQTFDGVYGGKDIYFYGYLNLFTWSNIRDHEVDFKVTPMRGLSLFIEYHCFTLDCASDAWYTTGLKAHRRDAAGNSGTALGHEVDVRVSLELWGVVEVMAGFGRLFPGEFIKNTGSAEEADWYFIQTTCTL